MVRCLGPVDGYSGHTETICVIDNRSLCSTERLADKLKKKLWRVATCRQDELGVLAYFPMYSWSFTISETQGVSLYFIILAGYWWKESGCPDSRREGITGARGVKGLIISSFKFLWESREIGKWKVTPHLTRVLVFFFLLAS